MKKVIVVIPIYNKILKAHEEISLKQCFKILKKHPITFVCAPELDVQPYLDIAKKEGKQVNIETFESNYFKDIPGYNKLMLSQKFYNRFLDYKHMLLYQTDAYVFRDELDDWCDLNYDYIGSPWLQDMEGWLYPPNPFPKELVLLVLCQSQS
ncbi:MAG: hypothetical protein EOP45_21145 [Sphingobacteriaceae bacterium]|nr:MAG: hypothetical protein EOP45_21145 [Sphingobacteriaceae bacterium]